jgi:hypothetical protein
MTTVIVIVVVVLVVAALVAGALAMMQNRRRADLQQRFGPEYDRAVEGAANRREAEQHLAGVAQRRDELKVRDLDDAEQAQYNAEWTVVQARFVDAPGEAVDSAETLISTVMRVRGYPVDEFDERADLISADHPDVVSHYREAHAAHERHRASGGDLDTEDLRQSFVHYRALFAVLVQDDDAPAAAPVAEPVNEPVATTPIAETDPDRADLDGSTETTPVVSDSAADPDTDAAPDTGAVSEADSEKNGNQPSYPQETR